jgi:PIN domain nuclease of toxin-antitoxin system
VRLLLDTHIWLWLLEQPSRVPPSVFAQISDATELVLSVATTWEIAIKKQLGKLQTKAGAADLRDEIVREMAATELAILGPHAIAAGQLPLVHKDPFDRMLVAQALVEDLILVTADAQVLRYGGAMLWAGD